MAQRCWLDSAELKTALSFKTLAILAGLRRSENVDPTLSAQWPGKLNTLTGLPAGEPQDAPPLITQL